MHAVLQNLAGVPQVFFIHGAWGGGASKNFLHDDAMDLCMHDPQEDSCMSVPESYRVHAGAYMHDFQTFKITRHVTSLIITCMIKLCNAYHAVS